MGVVLGVGGGGGGGMVCSVMDLLAGLNSTSIWDHYQTCNWLLNFVCLLKIGLLLKNDFLSVKKSFLIGTEVWYYVINSDLIPREIKIC